MLKSKEVCELIKLCGESGVSQLKWGDLRVNFKSHDKKPESPIEVPDTEISEQIENASAEVLVKEELKTRKDELDHMLVENPLAYEELIASGELEDETSGKVNDGEGKQ